MLEMRNITKRFDAVVALNQASLTVKQGEIMALLGSNGSGKSTMVKVLSGLVNRTDGEVFLDGAPLSIQSAADSRKNGIAVAYQDLSLIPTMSVVDNIVLGMEPQGKLGLIDRAAAYKTAETYLDMLHIDVDPNALVQFLMPSVQSMVEIAKAMAMEPKLLILDEATASLHSDEVDILFETLTRLKAQGTSIIMVTHRMSEIFRICDRCTILKSGETVAEGAISEMDLDDIVFHMTGKRPDKNVVEQAHVPQSYKDEDLVLDVRELTMLPQLNQVNFKAYKGEVVGIGGLDGQGQSEFIRAVLADVHHTSGQIIYQGKERHYKSPADAMADDMGFISGDRNRESIFPIRSVAENIFAGNATKKGLFSPLLPKKVEDFAKKAMADYGIVAGGTSHPANSLSGGNQQKLVVGRWIALAPKLLLLDDPTKGVDINSRREIHKILKECLSQGMSVIYVSSDNEELLEISDRIYVFYEGHISAELVGLDRTEEKMVSAMLGLNQFEQEGGDPA